MPMKVVLLVSILLFWVGCCDALLVGQDLVSNGRARPFLPRNVMELMAVSEVSFKNEQHPETSSSPPPRRRFLMFSATTFFSALLSFQQLAHAIPMVSVDEFAIILRDSPLSISMVEFSGTSKA